MSGGEEEDEIDAQVPDKLFFRIGEASQLVGVEPHVLRYWESEFKLRPQRSSTGQRMYRRKDVARFLRIRKLLHDQGFTIAGARKVLSGGGGPAAAASADNELLEQLLERVRATRTRITDARRRLGAIAAPGDQS
ncbi:MAG: DNA-binding transcriptional MerR regulator [Myxococcota bacterium]|jgi:DNA-binding transcriptional MerR regulator